MGTSHEAGIAIDAGALALLEPSHQAAMVKGVAAAGDTSRNRSGARESERSQDTFVDQNLYFIKINSEDY